MIPILIGISILIFSSVISNNINPPSMVKDDNQVDETYDGLVDEPEEITPTSSDSWYYPDASVTSETDSTITLESKDDPKKITNWYKNKISEKMTVKSFVTTTANDEVLNKLSGANGDRKIAVEITKSKDSSKVKINFSQTP